MLGREEVEERLARLDWSKGFNREAVLAALLECNLALPNEFLSAISPLALFDSPEQLIAAVPGVVWTIHGERERRARGRVQVSGAAHNTRQRQVL